MGVLAAFSRCRHWQEVTCRCLSEAWSPGSCPQAWLFLLKSPDVSGLFRHRTRAVWKLSVCWGCESGSGGGTIHQCSSEAKSSRESPPAAFKGQRPKRHRELRFSEVPAKQMVGIQLVEYFCTSIKQFLCGPLNFPSINEHQQAWRLL